MVCASLLLFHVDRHEQCPANLRNPCNKLYLSMVFKVISDIERISDNEAYMRQA